MYLGAQCWFGPAATAGKHQADISLVAQPGKLSLVSDVLGPSETDSDNRPTTFDDDTHGHLQITDSMQQADTSVVRQVTVTHQQKKERVSIWFLSQLWWNRTFSISMYLGAQCWFGPAATAGKHQADISSVAQPGKLSLVSDVLGPSETDSDNRPTTFDDDTHGHLQITDSMQQADTSVVRQVTVTHQQNVTSRHKQRLQRLQSAIRAESQLYKSNPRRPRTKYRKKSGSDKLGQLMSQLTSCSRELPDELLGEQNECEAIIDGVESAALIDTGSMVSSVSHHFWQAHMSKEALHPLSDLLTVNNASGDSIPYLGYVEVTVE